MRGIVPHFGGVALYITTGFFGIFGINLFNLRLRPAISSVIASLLGFSILKKVAGKRETILGFMPMPFSGWRTLPD